MTYSSAQEENENNLKLINGLHRTRKTDKVRLNVALGIPMLTWHKGSVSQRIILLHLRCHVKLDYSILKPQILLKSIRRLFAYRIIEFLDYNSV